MSSSFLELAIGENIWVKLSFLMMTPMPTLSHRQGIHLDGSHPFSLGDNCKYNSANIGRCKEREWCSWAVPSVEYISIAGLATRLRQASRIYPRCHPTGDTYSQLLLKTMATTFAPLFIWLRAQLFCTHPLVDMSSYMAHFLPVYGPYSLSHILRGGDHCLL